MQCQWIRFHGACRVERRNADLIHHTYRKLKRRTRTIVGPKSDPDQTSKNWAVPWPPFLRTLSHSTLTLSIRHRLLSCSSGDYYYLPTSVSFMESALALTHFPMSHRNSPQVPFSPIVASRPVFRWIGLDNAGFCYTGPITTAYTLNWHLVQSGTLLPNLGLTCALEGR